MPERRGARAKSAERVLAILELLSTGRHGLTFSQLVQATRFPKSSLHELLGVLVDRSFVSFDAESQRYSLGIRMWESGEAYIRHRDLVAEARPVMEGIVAELNETVQMAVLDGLEIVYVDRVDSSRPVRLQSQIGTRLPAYATGLGKVLLADLQDDELAMRLARVTFQPLTPRTITNEHDLFDEVARVRALGFAVDNEESFQDMRCVAVPLRGHRGDVVAAMSIAIPAMRASISQLATALALLAPRALEISARLGCGVPSLTLRAVQDRGVAESAIEQWLRQSDARLEPSPRRT